MMAAALFKARYSELDVTFMNKGISGNRAINLVNRWQAECIDLQPNVVSILIGVNDCWRHFDNNDYTAPELYEKHFRTILERTKNELNAKIIIIEPFLLEVTPDQQTKWREDLNPKIEVAKKLAKEYEAIFVPMDEVFKEMVAKQTPNYWAADGVHPSYAGHALIAEKWLEAVTLAN